MDSSSKKPLVLNAIKYFQAEYPEGVPQKILKLDLELSDDEINYIIEDLKSEKLIKYENSTIKLIESGKTELSKNNAPKPETDHPSLTENEQKAVEIIKELLGDSGLISRNILEGHLLYGDLKLSNLSLYNLLNSLDNKGILKRVQRKDGAYYVFKSSYKD